MQKDFYTYQAQTTPHPLAIEVVSAKGSYIFDSSNKRYLDFIAGVSACTLGHCHPEIIKAIQEQINKYLHVMVYGEFILEPAVRLTKLLAEIMPGELNTTYLTNSGTEAIEGSIKLVRRATGRKEVIYADRAYHGNTMGAMSVMGYEERRKVFEPLIPGTKAIQFNSEKDLEKITNETAAVILETIQGGAGFIEPKNGFLKKVKNRCEEVGSLLILDEIQTGFGRTGKMFGFKHYGIVPDILVIGKGMGGGMPIGAFTASKRLMSLFSHQPKQGHITTFGGHPVIAVSALATINVLQNSDLMEQTLVKEICFRRKLKHPYIKEIRGKGLMLAILLEDADITSEVILKCKDHGLLLFWLLFEPKAIRITPPLTISEVEIEEGCNIILEVLNSMLKK